MQNIAEALEKPGIKSIRGNGLKKISLICLVFFSTANYPVFASQQEFRQGGGYAPILKEKTTIRFTIPAEDTILKKNTPFGLHAVGMPFLNEVSDSGASIIRIIISGPLWRKLETESGLDFSTLDRIVRALQKNGCDLVITLDSNSEKWGARHLFHHQYKIFPEPTVHSAKPENITSYENTLSSIAERYDLDGNDDMPGLMYSVDYYQIVNEWTWQWDGGRESYLEHLKNSYKTIKSAHPHASIILGGLTGVEYLAIEDEIDTDHILKLGGMLGKNEPHLLTYDDLKKKIPNRIKNNIEDLKYIFINGFPYYDIIDLHSYTENHEEMLPSIEVIKKYAMGKDIWSLENSGPFYRYSPEKHCEEVIKRYVSGMAYGLKKIFWSSYNPTSGWPRNFLNLSLLDNKGRQKPAYYAYKFIASRLTGIQRVIKQNGDADIYKVILNDGDMFIVWSKNHKKTLKLPWPNNSSIQAITLSIDSKQQLVTHNVAMIHHDDYLELEVTTSPVFIGLDIKITGLSLNPN